MTEQQQEPLLVSQNKDQYRVLSQNTGKAVLEATETIEEIRSKQSQQRVGSNASKEVRTYSLSNRGTVDFQKLVDNARDNCVNPIKLSWSKVCFEVEIKTSA